MISRKTSPESCPSSIWAGSCLPLCILCVPLTRESQCLEGMPCSGRVKVLCVELGAESWFSCFLIARSPCLSCYTHGGALQESSEGLCSLLCLPDLHSEWEHFGLCDVLLSLSGHAVTRVVLPDTCDDGFESIFLSLSQKKSFPPAFNPSEKGGMRASGWEQKPDMHSKEVGNTFFNCEMLCNH